MRLVQRLNDDEVKSINKMIEKFNLIVPNMNNQMFRYKIDPDEDNIYKTGYDHTKESSKDNKNSAHESMSHKQNSDNKGGLFSGMFQSLFNKWLESDGMRWWYNRSVGIDYCHDMNGAQPSIDHRAHNALENISDILIQFVLQ